MTFPNGGQRDEYHPNRRGFRGEWVDLQHETRDPDGTAHKFVGEVTSPEPDQYGYLDVDVWHQGKRVRKDRVHVESFNLRRIRHFNQGAGQ